MSNEFLTTKEGAFTPKAVEALVSALREVEWSGSAWIGIATCPACGNEQKEGHTDDCVLSHALGEGGKS